jgi:hypothetical protein
MAWGLLAEQKCRVVSCSIVSWLGLGHFRPGTEVERAKQQQDQQDQPEAKNAYNLARATLPILVSRKLELPKKTWDHPSPSFHTLPPRTAKDG